MENNHHATLKFALLFGNEWKNDGAG